MTAPLILYVPGLLPKPEAGVHREALRRCLAEGLRRHDAELAEEFTAADRSFDLVAWTYDFYREHRDFALDSKSIDELLNQPDASKQDIGQEEVRRTAERVARVVSMAAHHFNFGIRSYYFALAVLAWFVSPWLFVAAAALVVYVLYRREFHSSALSTLMSSPSTKG